MITISALALKKAKEIVELAPEEITFFGFVVEDGNNLIIKDIYLPEKQKFTGATTEVLAEEYDKMIDIEENLQKEYGTGHFRCHIHSHVNMSVFQSGVDVKTFEEFLQDLPYYIAIIMNKKGEIASYFGAYGISSKFDLNIERIEERSDMFNHYEKVMKEMIKYNEPKEQTIFHYPNLFNKEGEEYIPYSEYYNYRNKADRTTSKVQKKDKVSKKKQLNSSFNKADKTKNKSNSKSKNVYDMTPKELSDHLFNEVGFDD